MKTLITFALAVSLCLAGSAAWAQQQPQPVPSSLGGGPGQGVPPAAPIINQGIHPGPVSSGIHPR